MHCEPFETFLQEIILPGQSAFILGRMITDNALIAFERLHAISTNSDDRGNFCAYKLDLSKAYDRVDWGFLENILSKLGFQSEWVHRIMVCVTSVRYTIRFNGALSTPFSPSCGLRQGYPLSSYLFLFVADGLSQLIKSGPMVQVVLESMTLCVVPVSTRIQTPWPVMAPAKSMVCPPCTPEFGAPMSIRKATLDVGAIVVVVVDDDLR